MKYRKKPVVVEAVRAGEAIASAKNNWAALPAWLRAPYHEGGILFLPDCVNILTLEGTMTARPADWIIRGVKGKIYPCKPDIFEATYEPVGPAEDAQHRSDCAVHNAPALPPGPCDCGATP